MQRVQHVFAFVLHTRPYSNSSLIADVFTEDYGIVSVLARSARGPKSKFRGCLQLFYPLALSWQGKSELKFLNTAESAGAIMQLEGRALACGFYLNELLVRLLPKEDPAPHIFHRYHAALQDLVSSKDPRPTLRYFEKHCLDALGYGLPLQYEARSQTPISPQQAYLYCADSGFRRCDLPHAMQIQGRNLIALANECLDDAALPEISMLMRHVLQQHLGNKPIKSRELLTT